MTRKIIFVLWILASSQAWAAEKPIPINFVGDWCFSLREGRQTDYMLPSWTEDGHCTQILSISEFGFYFTDLKISCGAQNIRVSRDTAPSGTTYTAKISARCQADGPVTAGKLQNYELRRYKGSLNVTAK